MNSNDIGKDTLYRSEGPVTDFMFDERVASEGADVVYHVLVGLLSRGLELRAVAAELARRFGRSGHDEKASRRR